MIGYFVVDSFLSSKKDSAGFEVLVNVHSQTFPEIEAQLYLPPYLRKAQCAIAVNSVLFGIIDDVTGIGFGMFGTDNSDFGYYFDSDIVIKKKLNVVKEIESGVDVLADGISLKNHTHSINAAQFSGTIDPATGAASGTISGSTEPPTASPDEE